MDGLLMYRRIFLQSAQGFGANLLSHDSEPMAHDTLGCTFIFSSIGDALSRAFDSAKETVSDVADKVADTVSDAYDATRETVGNVAEAVSDTASTVYSSTVETLSDAAETVGDVVSDAYDATRETVSNGYDATRDYVGDVVSGEKEIDYLKVLGGAAIGVGAIAAAPFTGGGSLVGGASLLGSLAGVGTIAAAVGAGVAGAVVAANLDGDEEARKAGFDDGVKHVKAEKAMDSLKAAGAHFNAIVALNAVAVATAQCDGDITPDERANIELFINGLAAGAIPEAIKAKIESLYQQPPTVTEAFELAKKSGMSLSIFDEIINLVVFSDDTVHPREAAFMQAWNSLKTA
jgi:uncharacterized membrane protein YebE (DUF533 family)